jgi:DNA repair ATPase RecN
MASQHFLVRKKVTKGRTISSLQEVAGEERVRELMRMLGGESKEAKSMAKSLLNQG